MPEERVDHPAYYNTNCPFLTFQCSCGKVHKLSLECIDVIRNMPLWKGNAIKYLWRAGLKDEMGISSKEKAIEDLKKALWYIQDKIKELEEDDKT